MRAGSRDPGHFRKHLPALCRIRDSQWITARDGWRLKKSARAGNRGLPCEVHRMQNEHAKAA